ncbi:MAG: hypothetical protein HND57_11810 [Planctomycetes bacterium]|nr:hypothetical protein [Planctomycetota bacterium]
MTMMAPAAWADDNPQVHSDSVGDAVIRRTDAGNDGPINAQSHLPDLVSVTIGGWQTSTPTTNPYSGQWKDPRNTVLFRIDVVLDGLVNPPGPIDLLGDGYNPYKYGPHPVYGFIEFDIDESSDTGGEVDGVEHRPLANASRFGGRFSDSIGERQAETADDLDNDLCSDPLVERSGEEFHLSLCACQYMYMMPINDPTPATFDEGDTWIVTGRLFRRTHAFIPYSFAYGGYQFGDYDPEIQLRFRHSPSSDQTTISLVFAQTNAGSALLRGESEEQIDFNVGNQTSILEAMAEMRFSALYSSDGPCTNYDLLQGWGDENHQEGEFDRFLEVDRWNVLAVVGTTYSERQNDALYVWTDIGPHFESGDLNGDSRIGGGDQNAVMSVISKSDGTWRDGDQTANGQLYLPTLGEDFSLYDINYDGFINAVDLAIIGYEKRGDVNSDRQVNSADLLALQTMLGVYEGNLLFNPAADLVADGVIDAADGRLLQKLIKLKQTTQPGTHIMPGGAQKVPGN